MMRPREAPKNRSELQKERHIVKWTPEEDDLLREQIKVRGTESWTAVASLFNNKTSRQCRRRWYTYLNSDFRKGSWSEEEDRILCEAQRIYGNKWTEIAKVVSGRTDNAVKNRFTTLCKKRAKCQTFAKENKNHFVGPSMGVVFHDGSAPKQQYIPILAPERVRHVIREQSILQPRTNENKDKPVEGFRFTRMNSRSPLSAVDQNSMIDHPTNITKSRDTHVNSEEKTQGTFLQEDDPKMKDLLQQAELLSSLAVKVNAECSSQSLEDAYKVLEQFLHRKTENMCISPKDDEFLLNDLKEVVDDLKAGGSPVGLGSNEANPLSWSEHENGSLLQSFLQNSSEPNNLCSMFPQKGINEEDPLQCLPGNFSETHPETGNKTEDFQSENEIFAYEDCHESVVPIQHQAVGTLSRCSQNNISPKDGVIIDDQNECSMQADTCEVTIRDNIGAPEVQASSSSVFSSPSRTIPLFQPCDEIPTPMFSESERRFLMRTFGMTSPSPAHNTALPYSMPDKFIQCRRAIHHNF